jgi:hypothetical protein
LKKLLRVGLVFAVWAPIFFGAARIADSLDAADFSGYDMGAKSAAVQFIFDSPSLGIPANPTGEMNLAFSEATLRSGPAAYALGSIAWPGQVAAALPIFLQAEIERQSMGQIDFPMDVPGYPVRAESFHPQGPPTATLDAGTMHMRSSARAQSAEGVAYLNKFTVPFVGTMGNQSSFAQNGFDPDGAVAMTEAAANDISLLGGAIKIDSVVTRATARSDGVKGTVAGTTTVAGAEIAGTAVRIDSNGVHVADQSSSVAPAQQAVNQVLNQLGVTIELAKPVDSHAGPQASRALNGLIIRIKSETLNPIIDALPQELQTEIRGQITFDQTIAVQIAPAAVTAGAARTIDVTVPPVEAPTGSEPDVSGADEVPVGDAGGADTGSGEIAPSGPATSGEFTGPVAIEPVRVAFGGVPLWLVIALVLLALASSRPLTILADKVFAARAGAGRCPYERG